MFILKIHQPGVEVQQIKMVNGTSEFCQEFFDDVPIPVADVVGEVNDGWTVASRLLYHERNAAGGGSPFVSGAATAGGGHGGQRTDLLDLARETGRTDDPRVRQLVAEARVNDRVHGQLIDRVSTGIRTGALPPSAGALSSLFAATNTERHLDIGLEIAGAAAGAWLAEDSEHWGVNWLFRQGLSLGGGSNEIQRNIISERVLGMPREYAADRDKPFDEVRHN
jgi:alkylation response protein AidB-like acyl-CoA dehydrogenase